MNKFNMNHSEFYVKFLGLCTLPGLDIKMFKYNYDRMSAIFFVDNGFFTCDHFMFY